MEEVSFLKNLLTTRMLFNHFSSNIQVGAAIMPAKKTTKRKTEAAVVDGDKYPKKVKGKLCTFYDHYICS